MTQSPGTTTFESDLLIDKFVGREELLTQVDAAIADRTNRYAIRILGEGGIGKTALLREIQRRYRNQDDVVILQLDYSTVQHQSLSAITERLVRQFSMKRLLGKEDLAAFQRAFDMAQAAYFEGKSDEEVGTLQDKAYALLIGRTNNQLAVQGKRLLILSDTVEASTDVVLGRRVNALGAKFNNAVIIVAGRPQGTVRTRFDEEYHEIYGAAGWILPRLITLKRFELSEAMEYFGQVLTAKPDKDLVGQILTLTGGKPVLLAFAVEWFQHNAMLPRLIRAKIKEIDSLSGEERAFRLAQVQADFERELVESVLELDGLLPHAIRALSFLDRRYDRYILQLALGVSGEEVAALEPALRRIAYMRTFLDDTAGLLHDEAKRLIDRYLWPAYDFDWEGRKALARKIVEGYYLPEIRKLCRQVAETVEARSGTQTAQRGLPDERRVLDLEIECLDYQYRVSTDNGRRYLSGLLREGLSLEKQEGIYHELINQVGRQEAEVARVRMNVRRWQFDGVREVLEAALQQPDLPTWYRFELLAELSDLYSDPHKRVDSLREAASLAQQAGDERAEALIHNEFGLMYRRQGLWSEAEQAYETALSILTRLGDVEQRATTVNNLAYVKLLAGDIDMAENLASIALNARRSHGSTLGLAFSYLTKAEIAEAKGNQQEAVAACEKAAQLFESEGRDQFRAKAQIYLARAMRINKRFPEAENLLQPALSQPPSEIRAQAERELAAVYYGATSTGDVADDTKYRAALDALEESLETCRITRDFYNQALALCDLIRFSYHSEKTIPSEYRSQLETLLDRFNYPVIRAQLQVLLSDQFYGKGDVDQAFRLSVEAASVLATHDFQLYDAVFADLRNKFLSQPRSVRVRLSEIMISGTTAESKLGKALRSLCETARYAFDMEP